MKQWWQDRTTRERRIVLAAALVLLSIILYWNVWSPLQQHLQQLCHDHRPLLTIIFSLSSPFTNEQYNHHQQPKLCLLSNSKYPPTKKLWH